MPSSKMLKILGVGNPLLDMVSNVPIEFIKKYDLKLNDMHLADEKHMPLYKELPQHYDVKYIAGGATQNSIRICQRLLKEANVTAYSGCVGNDEEGKNMEKMLENEGVTPHYCIDNETPTGTSAILVNSFDRAMCTNLGAANKYTFEFMKTSLIKAIEEADIIYSAGFFATVCPEGMIFCGEHCAKNNKPYCFCLAALFIIEFFKQHVESILPYTDYLFGNAEEFQVLATHFGLKNDTIEDIVKQVVDLPKVNQKRSRMVIATQGADEVIIGTKWVGEGVKILKFPVQKIPKEQIVDSNGCGDAFIGGFLYGLSKGMDLERCTYYGNLAGGHVLKQSGCAFTLNDVPQI